ncbi:hypothetical protein AB0A95_30555 [Micromonospora sp. NPDC049230]|uniref:hypothetical protein n=1 Tax=Micromonospora sp. NPDC049230 TaxID=3155502 RepID=UPI0034061D4C
MPAITYVAGALALIASVTAAVVGLAGTMRTTSAQRAANLDKRVDDRLEKEEARNLALEARNLALQARNDVLTADRDRFKDDRDRYRELYVELRLEVMRAGHDPDDLLGEGAGDGQA